MAGKKRYFSDLWRELAEPDPLLRPAYFLYGPEELLIRRSIERMSELCGQVKPFDYVEFLGGEVEFACLAEELTTLPMVAERRLVIVHQAEKLLAKARKGRALSQEAEQLRDAANQKDSTSCLMFHASPAFSLGAIPGRALIKDFASFGVYPLSERQLISWISRGAKKRDLRLEPGVSMKLITAVGRSLLDIENELDKFSVYLGAGGVVKSEIVDDLVGGKGASLKEFLEAVAVLDIPRALHIEELLLLVPRNSYRVIPALTGLLTEINSALTKSPDELAQIVPRWRMGEVLTWSRQWSKEHILEAIDALYLAELSLKSGRCRIDSALVQFLASLPPSGTGS